jgi:hypothetical protein
MRKLFVLLTAGFLVLGMAGVAGAAVLNWSGTAIVSLNDYPEGILRGGGVATINGSAGVIPAHLDSLRAVESRGQVAGTFTRFVTDPDTLPNGVYALIYDQVGALDGTWAGISGGVASTATGEVGIMPLGGVVKVCILSYECTTFLPLVLNQPNTLNGVVTGSRGAGVGGIVTAGGYGGIRISLQGAPWTVKTATVIDQITPTGGPPREFSVWYAKGWAHAPVSTTTSTAQPGGMVQLVTPNQVTTNLPLGSSDKMGSFVITVIEFIPEPGLLLLLGSGVAGLALVGRSRMKR